MFDNRFMEVEIRRISDNIIGDDISLHTLGDFCENGKEKINI